MFRLKKKVKIALCLLLVMVVSLSVILNINTKNITKEINSSNKQYNQVQKGEEKVSGTDFVTFDAFFLKDTDNDGQAESYRGSSIDLSRSEKLYLELKVLGDVKIKSGSIKFVNDNVRLSGIIPKSSVFKTTYQETDFKSVSLNTVGNGTSSLVELNVYPEINDNPKKYTGTNKVIFKGIVVDNNTNEEKEITKEISYDVDWYASRIYISKEKDIFNPNSTTEDDKITVKYTYLTSTTSSAVMKEAVITGTISSLLDMAPESVKISSSSGEVEYMYEPTTQTFTAVKKKSDVVKSNYPYDYVRSGEYYNKWYIEVTYPKLEHKLYDAEVYVNLLTWSYATNNESIGYDDVKSNTISDILRYEIPSPDVEGNLADGSSITIGERAYSKNEYSIDSSKLVRKFIGEDSDNLLYEINLNLKYMYETNSLGSITVNDKYDTFKSDGDTKDYVTYKGIRIMNNSAVKTSTITVINNETDEVLYVYNQDTYGANYEFPAGVKTIRLEVDNHKSFVLYDYNVVITKEIDGDKMVKSVDLVKFNTYNQLSTTYELVDNRAGNNSYKTVVHQASAFFEPKKHHAGIVMDNRNLDIKSIAEPEVTYSFKVGHQPQSGDIVTYNSWKDYEYLLVLPDNVIDVNNVFVSGSSISVKNKEIVKLGNRIGVKLSLHNSTYSQAGEEFTIKAILDSKNLAGSKQIELYAYDDSAFSYSNSKSDIYDINNNGKFIDNVQYSSITVNVNIPKEMITGAQITNYDSKGSKTMSPLVADVELLDGKQTADMEIFVLNNSANPVNGIVVMGKLGYIGNTYQIGTGDLGSEFKTTIKSPITVPDEIKDKTKIYYSDKETPTQDLEDAENNWVEVPNDLSTIKSYMIVVDKSYSLASQKELDFTYKIGLPNNKDNLLKVSYFNHGVYFNYETDSGNYATDVSSGKLGVRVSRKVDLKVKNLKKYSSNVVTGSSYILTDEEGNTYRATTDLTGVATFKNIYVEKEYKLVQSSSNGKYVVDPEEKSFKVLYTEPISYTKTGTMKNISFSDNALNIELENEMYYDLKINVTDTDDGSAVDGLAYTVTGKNHENGSTIYTRNGIAELKNLEINNIYVVEPLESNIYIKTIPFKVMLIRDSKTKEIKVAKEYFVEPKLVSSSYTNKTNINKSEQKYTLYPSFSYGTTGYLADVIELDLTKGNGDYVMDGDILYGGYTVSPGYLRLSLSTTQSRSTYFINYPTNKTTKFSVTQTGNGVKLEGGKKYYLTMDYYKNSSTYTSQSYVGNFRVHPVGKDYELIGEDGYSKLNVYANYPNNPTYTLKDAKQSLKNYSFDSTDNPVVQVDILSKRTPRFNFVINKIDQETKKPLKGAIFKIEGFGLPEGGKYIKTDENGNATVELNSYYSGWVSSIIGLREYSYYPYNISYTLKEIIAPQGYRVDSTEYVFRYSIDAYSFDRKIEYLLNSKGSESEHFINSKIDEDNDVLTVEIGNSPIVRITKTDADTGDFLPDTYFAIYYVERLSGTERLTPAKDAEGKIIGEKVTIGDNEYYVVKTDSKGNLNLSLGAGTYQLKEVMASNEKYEIDNEIYYFSIGKNVEPEPASIEITKAGLMGQINNYYISAIRTNDGGYLVYTTDKCLTKYDKDFNIEWKQEDFIQFDRITYYKYVYLDDPSKNYSSAESTNHITSYYATKYYMVEGDDAYFFHVGYTYIKVDKKTGEVLVNGYEKNKAYLETTYDGSKYISTLAVNMYYVAMNSMYIGPDGYIYIFMHTREDYNQAFETVNGKRVDSGGQREVENFILKYDQDGNMVDVVALKSKVIEGLNQYVKDSGLTGSFTFDIYHWTVEDRTNIFVADNGDIMFTSYMLANGTYMKYIAKFDKDFNLIKVMPLGFMGNQQSSESYNGVKFYKDGSFSYSIGVYQSESYGIDNTTGNPKALLNTKYTTFPGFTLNIENSTYDASKIVLVKYTKDWEIDNVWELGRRSRNVTTPSPLLEEYHKMYYNNMYIPDYKIMEDNSVIVATGNYISYNSPEYRTFYLKDDTEVTSKILNDGFTMIYKIDKDSNIEWAKEYDHVVPASYNFNSYNTMKVDDPYDYKKFNIILKSTRGNDFDENLLDGTVFDLRSENQRYMLAEFELTDKVNPAAPEAYILELVNKVKEFGINILTTTGGKVIVMDGDTKVYEGSGPKEVEKVKFSADSKYDIIVKPDEGYDVVSIKVNGEDATYTVKEDGTIVLDKIKKVLEPKNITVEFKQSVGRVVVHHYLKGTKSSVFSDQVVTGIYGSPYEVLPVDSKLYSLAKDSNGEYVMPDNYQGLFTNMKTEVTFYYEPRMVNLLVSYYEEGTTNKLAETTVKAYILGSKYITKALDIKYYKVSSVLGDEEGFINEDELEVTYFYVAAKKSTITVIYRNAEDGSDIDRIVKQVDIGDYYKTEGLKEIPEGYEFANVEGVPEGIAEYENIVVTYNYKKIKVNPKTPETSDNIIRYVFLGLISLIVMIITGKQLKIKRAN